MTNTELDAIHKGWLVKSPPKKKIQIIKAKWRRRYFVLHVPPASSSLPGSYRLDYYDSPALKKKRGYIDLDLCEEILAKLGSRHYEHLFSLETKHKGADRKYFLAAETEEEMNKWVECLCMVCGFRPDADPSEGAIVGHSYPVQQTTLPENSSSSQVPSHIPDVVPQPRYQANSVPPPPQLDRDTPNSSMSSDSQMDYKQLWDCYSGSPNIPSKLKTPLIGTKDSPASVKKREFKQAATLPRSESLDSIPDEPPPPPPEKLAYQVSVDSMAVNIPNAFETYDHPRSVPGSRQSGRSSTDSEDLYKVPPVTRFITQQNSGEDFYKVPPSHHELDAYDVPSSIQMRHSFSKRDSSSSSGSQGGGHQSTYDYPPPRRSPPHKNSNMIEAMSRTSNIRGDSTYDVPTSWRKHSEPTLSEPVPAPPPRASQINNQLHAVPPVSSNPYMGRGQPNYQNSALNTSSDDTYDIPPSRLPPNAGLAPPLALPPKKGANYVNMNAERVSKMESSPENSVVFSNNNKYPSSHMGRHGQTESIYQAPSSNRALQSAPSLGGKPPILTRSMKLNSSPRIQQRQTYDEQGADANCSTINVTNRTKSFRRRLASNSGEGIQLPERRYDDSSSSDSDSPDSLHNTSTDNIDMQPTHTTFDQYVPVKKPANNLSGITPPAPGAKETRDLQYLELGTHDGADPERSPCLNRSPPPGAKSPTDYKEIDFIKTKALEKTMKNREDMKRTSTDKTVDE